MTGTNAAHADEREPRASEPAESAPTTPPSLGVIIVAAGNGLRLGADVPKAFVELQGRPLLSHGIETVLSLEHYGQLVIVAPKRRAPDTLALVHGLASGQSRWRVSVVSGGRERYESVRFGLAALHDSVDTVLVHDAARPLASAALFERVASEVRRTGDSVIPALLTVDTLKRVDDEGVVHETIDRASLVGVQTPQGFPREVLAAAHETAQLQYDADSDIAPPTDDAELVQRGGGTVRTVRGEERAHKITTADDLTLLEARLAYESSETTAAGTSSWGTADRAAAQ
ncbi:MAG: 2-C-methyl-D-erythritol 4-phosphate cytidylyltransferase [Leucobacter sp.]